MALSSTTRILFVCRANVCRSPMAEAIFSALAREAGLPARAESAGVAALVGQEMDDNARVALKEIGIYPVGHTARQAERELIEEADLVLTMSPGQRGLLLESFETSSSVIDTLPGYANCVPDGGSVADPHGKPMQFYRATCREILGHVSSLIEILAASCQDRR